MKKYKRGLLVVAILLFMLPAQSVMAYSPTYFANPHYVISNRQDLCSSCHQMTSGIVKPTYFISTTIWGTCYTCHNGTKSNYNVATGMDAATGTPGFAASFSIHKVKTETYYQPILDSSYPSMKLTCVSCHAAHGNTNYRYLKTTLPTGAANLTVNVALTRPTDYATSKDTVIYESGLDNWCAGCHDKNLHFSGGNGTVRHLSDYSLSPAVATIYNAYTYIPGATDWHAAPKVPIGVGTATDGNGNIIPGNEQRVICMSCHQAHGSNYDKNLVRDKRGRICMQCHLDSSKTVH